ncbi:MAG: DNA-directed RNA polymerase subunit delta [Erysipelotrichaceae bacterium]|jgi:DNA-directed RNA polymerase subunit delta|nr:DNA-directed RNA polymerase subunit delta [Erysipelotrichaceae bacterium]
MNKPMIDIAYEVLTKKKKAMTFLKIWEETSQVADLNEQQKEDNIAQFYTDVSLDDRFVHVGNNEWDLRSRHTYKEVVIDTSDLLIEEAEDEEETFDTEDTEEKTKEEEFN